MAVSHQEYEVGLESIAAPLAWIEDHGRAALNVSLPSSRARGEAAAELAAGLQATATAIEAAAGVQRGGRPFAGAAA